MSLLRAVSTIGLFLSAVALRAQLLPDRTVVFAPLSGRPGTATRILAGADLHGEFARTLRGDSSHHWSARVGGSANVVRVDSSFSLDMLGMTEIIIDPNNDIAFNPRAIFWEEGVAATFRTTDRLDLQFGFSHRCKHDIDNFGTGTERTLIYSSLYTRLLTDQLPLTPTLALRAATRLDAYLYKLDSRSEASALGATPNIENLVGSGAVTLRLDWTPWNTPLGFALTGIGGGALFSNHGGGSTAMTSATSLDLAIVSEQPASGSAALFFRLEYLRDAGIEPRPRPASLVWIGVRIGATDRMW